MTGFGATRISVDHDQDVDTPNVMQLPNRDTAETAGLETPADRAAITDTADNGFHAAAMDVTMYWADPGRKRSAPEDGYTRTSDTETDILVIDVANKTFVVNQSGVDDPNGPHMYSWGLARHLLGGRRGRVDGTLRDHP